jgi:hypothetical protein
MPGFAWKVSKTPERLNAAAQTSTTAHHSRAVGCSRQARRSQKLNTVLKSQVCAGLIKEMKLGVRGWLQCLGGQIRGLAPRRSVSIIGRLWISAASSASSTSVARAPPKKTAFTFQDSQIRKTTTVAIEP